MQRQSYFVDLERLLHNRKLAKRSVLRNLCSFIDEKGVIRICIRLTTAPIPYNRKYPIVLPAKSHLFVIFVRHIHEKYFHANCNFLQAFVSGSVHITSVLTNVIKSITCSYVH